MPPNTLVENMGQMKVSKQKQQQKAGAKKLTKEEQAKKDEEFLLRYESYALKKPSQKLNPRKKPAAAVESSEEEDNGEPTKSYTLTLLSENVDTTAATDNKLFIQLIGTKGQTSKLDLKLQHCDTEVVDDQLKQYTTTEEMENVGKIKKAKIYHVNKDNGLYEFYLGSLTVTAGKRTTKFRVQQKIEHLSGEMTILITPKPEHEVEDDYKLVFNPANVDSMHGQQLRSIHKLKQNLDRQSETYKLLDRAEEIMKSDDYIAKKEKSRQYLTSVGLLDEFFEERMEEMAIDIAERENERHYDQMQFERAGLSPEEQEKIPKLDETNNLSYKYLRDHGNMWQYDPAKVHNSMKARLYRRFDTFDKDSDGVMTLDEVLTWADRMRSIMDTSEEEVESIREALRYYFTLYGLGGDGLRRENWVEAHVTMGAAVKERTKHGHPVPMVFMANAYFDVIDEDDNGVLNLQELKHMMNVFRVPEEAAYTFFEAADVSNDGELDMEEMHKLFYRFWFGEYDSEIDGIFAYKY